MSSELRFKLVGSRVIVYLTFTKHFEVEHNPRNAVAVDVNENNATVALFKSDALTEVYRVETNLGRHVIEYSERRKRITGATRLRSGRLGRSLRSCERGRKLDILRKTARLVEKLATEKAVVVISNIGGEAKERMERDKNAKLRHRIHQWSASALIKLLEEKPVHVVKVSEKGSSSTDPFTGARINGYTPLMIRCAVKEVKKVRVVKLVLRAAKVNGRALERDVVGVINIGLRYLNPDGSPMALDSTGTHEVQVKLVNSHRGAAPLTGLQVFTDITKYR